MGGEAPEAMRHSEIRQEVVQGSASVISVPFDVEHRHTHTLYTNEKSARRDVGAAGMPSLFPELY